MIARRGRETTGDVVAQTDLIVEVDALSVTPLRSSSLSLFTAGQSRARSRAPNGAARWAFD